MTVDDLRRLLAAHPGVGLHFMLPDGDFVPAHFHVTEVGRVRKDFIDCGGTARASTTCVLQVWVAGDTDHRLDASKLAAILKLAGPLLDDPTMPVEVEYEAGVISQYPLTAAEVTPRGLLFHLGGKHTDCLAPEKCNLPGAAGCC